MVAELKNEKASRDNQDQAHWLLRANCGTGVGSDSGVSSRVDAMRCGCRHRGPAILQRCLSQIRESRLWSRGRDKRWYDVYCVL